MSLPTTKSSRKWVWIAMAVLAVLHQDIWFWNNPEPYIFGFIPIGLAYHAAYSVAAAIIGVLAIKYAWPHELEAMAEESNDPSSSN
jgi:hypothetical protein